MRFRLYNDALIKCSGLGISSTEVADALCRMHGIREAVAFDVGDEEIRPMALDRENLRRFLHEKQGLEFEDFADDTLLFSSGLIDSFSMVGLIIFIEEAAGFRVHPAEVTLDNFDSIDRILAFVEARCA